MTETEMPHQPSSEQTTQILRTNERLYEDLRRVREILNAQIKVDSGKACSVAEHAIRAA
jgi:hypothetical protein